MREVHTELGSALPERTLLWVLSLLFGVVWHSAGGAQELPQPAEPPRVEQIVEEPIAERAEDAPAEPQKPAAEAPNPEQVAQPANPANAPALIEKIMVVEADERVIQFDAGGGVMVIGEVFGNRVTESAIDASRLIEKITGEVQEDLAVMFEFVQTELGVDPQKVDLLRGCSRRLILEKVATSLQQTRGTWHYAGSRDRTLLAGLLDSELWKRCYNTTLTPEQRQRFEEAQEQRSQRAKEARSALLWTALDARLCLTPQQKEKILPLLERALEQSRHSYYGTDMIFTNPYQVLGRANADALKEVLDEDQKKDLDDNIQRWNNDVPENLLDAFRKGVE